ncbi:MAG: PQQ-like beta-propeller repeat protein, partial [Armatimonadetes bacterium]|nr:PQQ-like beta-propeller repeat protein [Armatimonadota bacterium]
LHVMVGLYAEGGQRRDPKIGRHTVLPWNEETQSFAINCAWDAFEESPLLDDALRLAATNAFLQFTRDLVSKVSGWAALTTAGVLPEYNHTTFPLLGIYGGARYFQRYYGLADMPDKLQRAHNGFRAQAQSWKAPEDSDSYLPIVPHHTVTYALAEDDRTYLTSGNLKRYADYVVGIVDNRGLGSGFGDSGFSSRPSQAEEALPLALWWTRDSGYQWLLDQFSPGWKSPYDRGLKPERPDRFTGLNVFMTDPHIYERIQTRPTYNEPFAKSEVPAAESFDKVSFRDGWDPDAQYLLLDGIGRGHHLHFDTNQIVEFVEGGERWLLDHDYLIRNTTEHNMLTVLRDGRGDQLVPSLAALSAHADLPGFAYTDSLVRGFNGCDWRRQILWQRGESFLVADTVTPGAAGDYDLELTWKTIDSAGEQRIANGRDLVAERGAGSAKTQNCLILDDPDASGGKALLMEQGSSRIAFGTALPAGQYRLKIIGYGFDGSSDSLWVSVNLGPNVAFHMPKLKYASSSGDFANTAESPMVTLEGQGPHLIIVTLRENPTVRVDRFIFVDAAGQETTLEAEALPPAPQPTTDLSRYLHLKTVSPVRAFVTNHERQGISVPISIYHQRQGKQLAAGESVRFCSLMYTSLPAKRRDLQPVELAPNLVALQGNRPALALLGPVEAPDLTAKVGGGVAAGLLTPDRLSVARLSAILIARRMSITSSSPVDLEVDLKTGKAVVQATQRVQIEVDAAGGKQLEVVTTGTHALQFRDLPRDKGLGAAIADIIAKAKPQTAAAGAQATAPTPPAWTAFATDADIGVMKTANLQDGHGPCLLVGRGPVVHCLDAQGKQLWQTQLGGKVRDVAVADLRPEPGLEVLVGSADTNAYIVSATGKILDQHQMRGTPWARSFGDAAYPLYNVGAWDLNGDGQPEIVVTMKNFDLQVMDRDWKLLFKSDWALHGSMQLSFEAAAGARPDTLFVGDKYGSVIGISGEGKRVFQSYTSIGDVFYGAGDINGDGKTEVINASSTGDTVATDFATAQPLWRFDNFGYPTNRVKLADLNGDGKLEVLLASGTGYLYVLDGAGKVLWQDRLGVGVNDVLVLPTAAGPRVVYADEGGLLRVADGAGKLVKQWRTEAPPRLLAKCGGTIAAALADGRVVGFGL